MTVSTKVPASRAGGSTPGMPMAGPIAAPRVVGNRRLRTGGIALAVMLLALGAALSAIALVSAARTASYLAVAKPVAVGQTITADDLTTIQLSGGAGLKAIPAAQVNAVIGLHAAVELVPGALLVPAELTNKPTLRLDEAQFGLSVKASQLPSSKLVPGQDITLIELGTGAGAGTPFRARIVDIRMSSDGSAQLYIAVPQDSLSALLPALTSGVAVVLKASN
jgi:hypothetical protein